MRLAPASCFAVAVAFGCSLERGGLLQASAGGVAGVGTGGSAGGGGIGTDASFGGSAGLGGVSGGGGAAPDTGLGGAPSGGAAGVGGTSSGGAAGAGGASGAGGGTGGDTGPDCALYPSAKELMLAGSRHCYFRVDPAAKWVSAKADCEAKGAYLATIHSTAENDVVRSLAAAASLWIGATDDKGPSDTSCAPASYHWITNEAPSFTSWASGNPNCNCGGCAGWCDCEHRVIIDGTGVWRDHYEGVLHPWVCEVGKFQ